MADICYNLCWLMRDSRNSVTVDLEAWEAVL